jgi:hypothetical protein
VVAALISFLQDVWVEVKTCIAFAPFAIHHEALLWSISFNLLLEVMWIIFYYTDS